MLTVYAEILSAVLNLLAAYAKMFSIMVHICLCVSDFMNRVLRCPYLFLISPLYLKDTYGYITKLHRNVLITQKCPLI